MNKNLTLKQKRMARYEMFIEGRDDCELVATHTHGPSDYMSAHAWAEGMLEDGYSQTRCAGCGLYVIWTKREPGVANPDQPNP